jgi:hypothetical protein
MTDVQVAEMQPAQAAERSQHAEYESENEADEIESGHQDAFFLRGG